MKQRPLQRVEFQLSWEVEGILSRETEVLEEFICGFRWQKMKARREVTAGKGKKNTVV